MDLSKVTKFDDNSLFRFLSKSYSKNRSKSYLNKPVNTPNLTGTYNFTRSDPKNRSQSSSFCNSFSKSISISQNYQRPRPGFLKYRKLTTYDAFPLNSSIQTPKNFLRNQTISLNTMNQQNLSDFKKSVNVFETNQKTTEQFGLRNLVKRVKNDFRFSGDRLVRQPRTQSLEQDSLSKESKKMFMGQKTYNINRFLITENTAGLFKRGREGIKTQMMKKKLSKGYEKGMSSTLE